MRKQSTEPADAGLVSAVESILLVAVEPVSMATLMAATAQPRERVHEALDVVRASRQGGIRLEEHAGHFRLVTAAENVEAVQRYLGFVKPPPLTRASLETLAVIAYRQPVTHAEIDAVRGVDSSRSLRTLLARNLIEEGGRQPGVGRPIEYRTTAEFLEYFGLTSLGDLPPLPESRLEELDASDIGLRD